MKKIQQLGLFFLFLLPAGNMQGCEKETQKIILNQTYQTKESFQFEDTSQETDIVSNEIQQHMPTIPDVTTEVQTIAVYVCGEVYRPGVYMLEVGARVYQAVEAAGGMTSDALTEAVNLARVLSDSDQIYIPDNLETYASKLQLTKDSLIQTEPSEAITQLLDINNASVSELMQLPGIGQVKAEAIVAYRNEYGMFTTIEEIKNVPGIKEAAFEKIKGLITVF